MAAAGYYITGADEGVLLSKEPKRKLRRRRLKAPEFQFESTSMDESDLADMLEVMEMLDSIDMLDEVT